MATYLVDEIDSIGPSYGARLQEAFIRTTEDLLESCRDRMGRRVVAKLTGIRESLLLDWVCMVDLMRVPGIGEQFAEILRRSGVDAIQELRACTAEGLTAKCEAVNEKEKLAPASPTLDQVAAWIETAKDMEPLISQ